MPDTRVGTIDHPERYGVRSVSVYENSKGYHIKVKGSRVSLHGNVHWTTLQHVSMMGSDPIGDVGEAAYWPQDEDDEERQIAAAIQASLEHPTSDTNEYDNAPVGEAPAAEDSTSSDNNSRKCAICLTAHSDHIMRPCNHLIACGRCARRLAQQPCPMCRRHVQSVERVFF